MIDTGIDYTHPDLQGSLWINESEREGTDGVDDDHNGFIDDSLGWDFTDAPRFSDGGDYIDPDNDPMDEYGSGHGTQIAGIIAAQANNGIGIAGIGPDLTVMNIRAGTAGGYLEEDDVANALIYAIDNGAKIVNMSFGDIALSRFLKDIIYYAYQQGLIIIASAGNSGNDELHYPSGLPETISVGASDKDDNKAGFSSYGSTIDCVAPGNEIISTAVNGKYNSVSGTSFSAPIVSAIAGLILTLHPDMNPERIRNILKTSSDDILYHGWDQYTGSGRVSALKAVNVP
ncbi:MAG: S8 family serine peptidase, partial [Calditrichaceae bacterium]